MKLKRYRFLRMIAALAISGALLSSCALFEMKFDPYVSSIDPLIQEQVNTDNYYRPLTYEENYTDMLRLHPIATKQKAPLPTIGQQRILVIPVDFTDYRATNLPEGEQTSLTVLENAFFGNPQTTQWESLASFYHRSSYGQLSISGRVSSWFHSNEVAGSIANSGSKTVTTERILKAAIAWYKTAHDDISDYDSDGDGYIDAVYLIYAHPYIDNDSVFWAFTSFDTGLDGADYVDDPIGNAYVWASYHFLNVYNQKGDSHTFIHEFGHILGLADYYNTSSIPSSFPNLPSDASLFERYQYTHGPTGKVDMMDHSIGDHTALSKMLLNWTRPYVITAPGTITIRPFASSGDLIILASDWNGKAYDEYLAFEFYGPTDLNYVDSERAYGHDSARLMSSYGIKIYHIDARASYHHSVGDAFIAYEADGPESDLPPELVTSGAYYRTIAHTNTFSTTTNGYLLYRLLEKGETTTFLTGAMASNDTLFLEGDEFGHETFTEFMFNDDTIAPFDVHIDTINRYEATLTFSLNQ